SRRAAGAPPAVPRAAPHYQPRRTRGRWIVAASGRAEPGPPRRAVSGRAARVRPAHTGDAAPAAGRRRGDDQPRGRGCHVPGEGDAGRGHEPVSVWLLWRYAARLLVLGRD